MMKTTPEHLFKYITNARRRRLIWAALIILLGLTWSCRAEATASGLTDRQMAEYMALKSRIEAHYFSYDLAPLSEMLQDADALGESYENSWYPKYYAGLIHILIGNIVRAEDKKKALQHYQAAAARFEAVLQTKPSLELHTLSSMAYGKLASLETVKMVYYGCKAKAYMQRAFEDRPEDPKLYLIAGVHLMFTPKLFGGSKNKSKELLESALELNRTRREADRLRVGWASDTEIYAYLAQLEILKKNEKMAMSYAREALSRKPHYGFVHRDIIPHIHGESIKTTYLQTKPYCDVDRQ